MDKNTVINIKVEAEEKMTLKEKLEKFKDRNVVLCVATQEAWDKLMEVLKKQGYRRVPWLYYINWSSYEKQSTVQRWNGMEIYLGSINTYHPAAHCFIDITEDDFKPKNAKEKKMTLKEKIDLFCAKEVVLLVPTKDLFIKVCKELKARGIKWCDGTDADSSPKTWDTHRKETVIKFSDYGIRYSNRSWNKNSHIIDITEDDFKSKESPAQQVAKVVLESSKKQADKKEPLDTMCGGIDVSTHGDSFIVYVTVRKEGDAYIIQEVAVPKFIKGEKFTDENGVLGRIDDIHDSTYDCEMVTGEKYALRIDEADKKFKKITW